MEINRKKTKPEDRDRTFSGGYLVGILFEVLLFTYLALMLIESVAPGRVSSYVNLRLFFIEAGAVGLIAVLGGPVLKSRNLKPLGSDWLLIFCAGIAAAVIIGYPVFQSGGIPSFVPVFGGGLVVLLAALCRRKDD
ncbi:MAG: hypothetical protein HYX96_02620 [Chloroflexi bacterium]|nr:hypothetical protein [Chloroflexota bacterium]